MRRVPLSGVQLWKIRGILIWKEISAALAIGGFYADIDPAMADATVQRGICIGFMIIPTVVILIGAAVLAFGYRLDKKTA